MRISSRHLFNRMKNPAKLVSERLNGFGINNTLAHNHQKIKVSIVGSGNWGTTIAKIVSENVVQNPDLFHDQVKMWVFEEIVNGQKLTEIINNNHENVKYLPDIKLPNNLIALPDIRQTVQDSNLIIFNIPHQFLKGICKQLKGIDFTKVRGISCLKGLEVNKDGVLLLCHYIKQELGIHCGVLSGANLAPEVARGNYSETTIAYDKPDDFYVGDVDEDMLKLLFQTHYFHVRVCKDIAAVSLSGALKNIVALASGFVEGKGWGDNARAAIMRRGLLEMIKFGSIFFPNCSYQTFTEESAGVADLITSCLGGRNRKIGMEMARTGKSAQELEKELLNGQSAQGIITCKEVHELLSARGMVDDFPLFTATYRIAYENMSIDDLPSFLKD